MNANRNLNASLTLVLTVIAAFSCGCQTRLGVTSVRGSGDRQVSGVPFRVRETHTIRVYQYQKATTKKGASFKTLIIKHEPLPNPDHVFAINIFSESFAGHEFKVEFEPDSTLSLVKAKGTPDAEGAKQLVTEVEESVNKFVTLDDDIDAKRKARRDAEITANEASFEDVISYQENYRALQDACMEYRDDIKAAARDNNQTIYDVTISANDQATMRGHLKAMNKAAIGLGIDRPFPDAYQADLHQICLLLPAPVGFTPADDDSN